MDFEMKISIEKIDEEGNVEVVVKGYTEHLLAGLEFLVKKFLAETAGLNVSALKLLREKLLEIIDNCIAEKEKKELSDD